MAGMVCLIFFISHLNSFLLLPSLIMYSPKFVQELQLILFENHLSSAIPIMTDRLA